MKGRRMMSITEYYLHEVNFQNEEIKVEELGTKKVESIHVETETLGDCHALLTQANSMYPVVILFDTEKKEVM